jgi:hypothetical protein
LKYVFIEPIITDTVSKDNIMNLKKVKYKEIPSPHSAKLSVFSHNLNGTNIFSCSAGKLQQGQN